MEFQKRKYSPLAPQRKDRDRKSFPPNGYLNINPLLSAFYKVKFRNLQVHLNFLKKDIPFKNV